MLPLQHTTTIANKTKFEWNGWRWLGYVIIAIGNTDQYKY